MKIVMVQHASGDQAYDAEWYKREVIDARLADELDPEFDDKGQRKYESLMRLCEITGQNVMPDHDWRHIKGDCDL